MKTKKRQGLCSYAGCDREARAKGLCETHYAQDRRGGPLTPIRDTEPMVQVSFRCPARLKEAVEKEAKRRKISTTELWREAGELHQGFLVVPGAGEDHLGRGHTRSRGPTRVLRDDHVYPQVGRGLHRHSS